MIIDAQKYSGLCSCGREHSMETVFSVVESGCLNRLNNYLTEYGLTGMTVAVYDENTYVATAGKHPFVDREIVLSPDGLHADEHGVELLQAQLPAEAEILIAIGSGTIHDITRYCAYEQHAQFVSCPTAASVDGFCSSVAAMTWKGCKRTLTAVAPKLVIADLDVIKQAPLFLARSGFGDMIGKYVALTDWRIGHLLTGEFYCERIATMTEEATNAVVVSAEGIVNGDESAYEKLMYGLLLSGLAMQMMGNSRPASGAEHHISHLIEMKPEGLGVSSDALHGEKVGVGTLIALEEYHRIAEADLSWQDYAPHNEDAIVAIFGKALAEEIMKENSKNCAEGITGQKLNESFAQIADIIKALPDTAELRSLYHSLGVKSSLEDIQVSEDKLPLLIEYSPCVRNRVTLMRLRRCIAE
ncbi:MAG: sn-glycerol-1-phosphate dehydrogenase [Lachnospiraceae bacterium]|nr:sn-glycerol-1-phosphate dehydrogenase [Lachnospiraceae bacterium]